MGTTRLDVATVADDNGGETNATSGATAPPELVRQFSGPQSKQLAELAAVFEDLQYVLRCCEHLVTALNGPDSGPVRVETDPALVEALWTGALVGYVRCFSRRSAILTTSDLDDLDLDVDVTAFHKMTDKLRDLYASRHVNPRETYTIGAAQDDDGAVAGVAVLSTPRPLVDDGTVRVLGRIAYGLSGLLDARMQESQRRVLEAAGKLTPAELQALPLVTLPSPSSEQPQQDGN